MHFRFDTAEILKNWFSSRVRMENLFSIRWNFS